MPDFRQRALDVLRGKKPDRLPWFADLSWWVHAERLNGSIDLRYDSPEGEEEVKGNVNPSFDGAEGYLNLHRDLETGIYLPLVWPYRVEIDCRMEKERDGDREIITYHTPRGPLTEIRHIMSDISTWAYEKYMVASSADLPAFRYFIEAHQFTSTPKQANHLDDLYGSQGLPVVWVPRTPLSRFIVEMAGIESTVYALFEEADLMKEIFGIMEEKDDEPYKAAASTKCDLIMIADNLSSEIQSPGFFKEHALEYYRKRSSQLRERGKIVLAHIDGTLRGLLPILNGSGLNCAEGITPSPVGDIEANELRLVCGDNICLWGGIPGALFSDTHSDEDFESYVKQYIEIAAKDGNMILGIGDQAPPGCDLNRVKLVSRLCEEYVL
jgi:uroporphyrinogen decarboxylase-like protein